MRKRSILIIVSILIIGLVIAGLYSTFAASNTVDVTDNGYNITLIEDDSQIWFGKELSNGLSLVFAFMLYPIHALNLNLLKIKGRSDLIFKLEIIKIASILCTLAITVWFGIEVMCMGQIIVSFIALICNTYYTGKILNLGIKQQLKDITPAFTLSIITFSITYLITAMIENNYLSLILGLSVALSIYFGCAKIFKIAGYNEFKLLFLKNGK